MSRTVGLTFETRKGIAPQDVSEKLKADELRAIADDLALAVPSGATKKELAALIKAALPGGSDDENEGVGDET